ncbi:MAG: aldo/keto reductase [Dehalococcoidia bacterium]|nr:aldo/keto reductase [Dehalococcoidia bacterium]
MNYKPLGRTGVKVSELCLGAMMFGGRTTPDDSYAIIHKAIAEGVNFIDTANVYSRGKSEEVVGEAIARYGMRDSLVLATKVHGVMGEGPNLQGNSRRHIIQQCEASLKRLQTDYIDLYQIHRPQSDIPIDETLRAMDDLIRVGKVRYVGTSTYASWQLLESLWAAERYGLNRFMCEQPPYNLLDRRIERELLPMARTYGFAIIPWSPLGGGLLTGKYHRGEPLPEDARYANANPLQAKRLRESMWSVIEGVEAMARDKGCSMSQLALAWVAQQPGVTSPIIGPRTMEQFDDNMQALEITLTPEDLKRIDAVSLPGEHVAPFYEADFGPHEYRV